jgi:hypothetical protein
MKTNEQKMNELWDYLENSGIATKDELCLVTSINGTNLESLESVLYCRTAYRSLEQVLEMEGE